MKHTRMLVVNPDEDVGPLIALSSRLRVRIFQLVRNQPMNVREIAKTLAIPPLYGRDERRCSRRERSYYRHIKKSGEREPEGMCGPV